LDSNQKTLIKGDRVKVIAGKYKDKTGTIKHIYRNNLFLHDYHHMQNNGVFCVRGLHVVGAGLKVAVACHHNLLQCFVALTLCWGCSRTPSHRMRRTQGCPRVQAAVVVVDVADPVSTPGLARK
jgi:hypothetical protein